MTDRREAERLQAEIRARLALWFWQTEHGVLVQKIEPPDAPDPEIFHAGRQEGIEAGRQKGIEEERKHFSAEGSAAKTQQAQPTSEEQVEIDGWHALYGDNYNQIAMKVYGPSDDNPKVAKRADRERVKRYLAQK